MHLRFMSSIGYALFLLILVGLCGNYLVQPVQGVVNSSQQFANRDLRAAHAGAAGDDMLASTESEIICGHSRILVRTPTLSRAGGFNKFLAYLVNNGYIWQEKNGPLHESDLTGYDVVVIDLTVSPPVDIMVDEISRLQAWVANGGSLLLMTEQGADQALANAFGITFGVQRVVDSTDYINGSDWMVTYQTDNFIIHPIMRNIRTVQSVWGVTVSGGAPLLVTDADASLPNLPIAGAQVYGAGRIVALGDDDLLGIGIALGDNMLLGLNMIRWLALGDIPFYSHYDLRDFDGDGVPNAAEQYGWENPTGKHFTNLCDADSDDDGISDGDEVIFKTHPHQSVPAFTKDADHQSYDEFLQPSSNWFTWNAGKMQHWEMEATPIYDIGLHGERSKLPMRGMAIKGQLWSPEIFDYPAYVEPLESPFVKGWMNWGGIELELYSTDLHTENPGHIDGAPDFHLLIGPIGHDKLPVTEVNVDADLSLTVNWSVVKVNPINDFGLSIGDSPNRVFMQSEVQTTLWGAIEVGDPLGGGWGVSTDGDGNWGIKLGYIELGVKPNTTDPNHLNTLQFSPYPSGESALLLVQKFPVVDFNRWWLFGGADRYSSYHINTELDLRTASEPPCTEYLKVQLLGQVAWKIAYPFSTPNETVTVNNVNETLYLVIPSADYADPSHPTYGHCNNNLPRILNSSNTTTQLIGQTHIAKTISHASNQLVAAASTMNTSDESFKSVILTPFDSNGDAQNDAVRLAWDADTTANQTDVMVIVQVNNGTSVTHHVYGPYPTIGVLADERQLTFLATKSGIHHFTINLMDASNQLEDGRVETATLAAGPGDAGIATLTAFTPTISGQTATIPWRATTTLPQEPITLLLAVTAADDSVQILRSAVYTAVNSSEVSGQFVFTAPTNGHYEGKLVLLDANAKVEQERFIPLPIGVPMTTLTGNTTEAPVDTDNNGQPDTLQISTEVAFGEDGEYRLEGSLYNAAGQLIVKTHKVETKTAGSGQLILGFDGLAIYHHGQSGPYQVELALIGPNKRKVAATNVPYTTAAYSLGAFGVPPALLNNSYTESVIDGNGDGLYEELRIAVQVNISTPSTYTLLAHLRDSTNRSVAVTLVAKPLTAGVKTLQLAFKGAELREKQANGPYTLEQLELQNFYGKTIDQRSNAYTTGIYQHIQFTPVGAQLNHSYSDFGWDTNNNGLYNYLALNVGITVVVPGKYRVQGILVDPPGNLVPWSTSALYYLQPGNHTLRIPFDGVNVQLTGSTNAFTLGAIQLIDSNNQELDSRLDNVYTTAIYQHSLFEPGAKSATISLLYDDMEDGEAN